MEDEWFVKVQLKIFLECVCDVIKGLFNVGEVEKVKRLNDWMNYLLFDNCLLNEYVREIVIKLGFLNFFWDWDFFWICEGFYWFKGLVEVVIFCGWVFVFYIDFIWMEILSFDLVECIKFVQGVKLR